MGQTLENGVYLPSEGERNCYAGLKTNWEILDQKVADVTALQQAVAGALHREIVESLPTTDIDPNTIYMILSGTSATENVYNEFMYVNNAWELIGTSATDLTNYYTKSEVDGKLLLKASASDLTSHTGDTTIHVTASDKTKWNNQTYVFRYSSTALTASSTNSNTLLDNTDNLKVGDKVIDSSGVLFSITAIDTANSTFTIGTALIDLAQDSDVVHKSGNETVGGIKTFSDDTYIKNINFTREVASPSSSYTSVLQLINTVTYTDQTADKVAILNFRITADGNKALYPHENNQYALGLTSHKWSEIHGVTYYYGSSDTEFSDKFATVDTSQTISGEKQFTSTLKVNRFIWFNNPSVVKGTVPSTDINPYRMYFGNNLNYENSLFNIDTQVKANGAQRFTLRCAENVVGGNDTRFIIVYNPNDAKSQYFYFMGDVKPYSNNTYGLGDSSFKWSTINGLKPSALGMPDLANGIDISSYLDTSQSSVNTYTPAVNGWVSIKGRSSQNSGVAIIQGDMCQMGYTLIDIGSTDRVTFCMLPVTQNLPVTIWLKSVTSLDSAKFIPCQGNV